MLPWCCLGLFVRYRGFLHQELHPEPGCRRLQSLKAVFKVLEIAQGLPCAFIGQSIVKIVVCRCLVVLNSLSTYLHETNLL